jgi:protein O-GlcNAc transferase
MAAESGYSAKRQAQPSPPQRRAADPAPAASPAAADPFALAVQHHQSGRLAEAEALCWQILAAEPGHFHALNLLGGVAHRLGRPDSALDLIGKAVELNDRIPAFHCNLAIILRERGRLDEAVAAAERALALNPNFAEAQYHLGLAHRRRGDFARAIAAYRQAIALKPEFAEAYNDLANALKERGSLDEATAAYQRALALNPNYSEAHNNLGNALQQSGKLEAAVAAYRRSLALKADCAEAHVNLGNALRKLARHEESIASCDRALALNPALAQAHNHRGRALMELGRVAEAIDSYAHAIAVKPDYADAHNNLGLAFRARGRPLDALAQFDKALTINPNYAEAHINRGVTFREMNRDDEALPCFERALAINPDYAEAHNNLASTLLLFGRLPEVYAHYERALTLKPDYAIAHTNLIFALNFDPAQRPQDHQRERARWYSMHGASLAPATPVHDNAPDPERRLRIGYVSAHFRAQAATYAFAAPLLFGDRAQFEIFCYSDTTIQDELTKRFRESVDGWRQTERWSDDRLAAQIRDDRIDILVDLVGHMSGDRLATFARKPAPVQVSGWGEPTGTGLATMDYLFADPVLVPPAMRPFLRERVIDLPCFLGYWTPDALPLPGPLPALAKGYVTFGSFNRIAKMSEPVLRIWAAILREVPKARLVLKDRGLKSAAQQARVRALFAEEQITADRLSLLADSNRAAHFAAYQTIDLALDPFPHGGGMTTLDALWMGVPVITSPGETISSRLAIASLTPLGLTDFIAPSRTEYVTLAAAKAADLAALSRLRQSLRQRVADSPIGDSARYARAVDKAYRDIWRRWCAEQTQG